MKSRLIIILLLLLSGIYGCDNDDDISIPSLDGLSLYWDHEVFGQEGRRLRFEFYGTNKFENEHELMFNYTIDKRSISIRLIKSLDKGKCQTYPMPSPSPDDPTKCNPRGGFFIPEDQLETVTYTLQLITPYFDATSELVVNDDKIVLNIPSNEHFFSSISEVYPIPKNLLFGSVVYSGDTNSIYAADFFADLITLGLKETKVPDYPYRHLTVDGNGDAIEAHWEPDNHSIGFMYSMNQNFKDVVEIAKEHFSKTDLNLYLYSSNGDQGLMSQNEGITIVYAE